MFFSFKKKHNLVKSGILKGMTDIHSHILPGVDDGSPDRATSLELLQFLEYLGITSVWFTPHVMSDMQRNTTTYLTERFEVFQNYYKGPIRLHQAGEYMMDAQFTSKLPAEVLPLGKNHLLVETSYMLPPVGMKEILASVKQNGYFPVIAHPERYTYMDIDDYRRLYSTDGYRLQLNLMSLSGYYGPGARHAAESILTEGMYSYVGSDLHHLERYAPMLESMKLTSEQLDALSILIANNEAI